MIAVTPDYQTHAVSFCPMQMHAVTLTVPVPIATGGVEGQLYDETTGSLLFDAVTGAPLTW